ncbi:hypothetical protein GGS26DRAFT_538962 [Hypomontagnella submonticulosa]|nr:hypothetical protein GGS26DRAFT_538962 [Hypomontagnella submonticulosa]
MHHLTMTATTTTVEQSSAVLSSETNKRDELLLKMKGQTVQIPDLKPIFADWKGVYHHHISPWVEPLRRKVNERIQR